MGLDAQALVKARCKGEVQAGSGTTLAMSAAFEQALNVYYKTQRIVFDDALGAGPGNFTVKVGPVTPGTLGL
jgi:hypothetical protein